MKNSFVNAAKASVLESVSKPAAAPAYALEFADKIEPEDQVYESYGIKVIVDPKSLPYINGTELDFVREGLNTGFKFKNPNEKESCGCGKSFHV